MQPKQSPLYVQSLGTGIAVLETFDSQHASMNLPEIAAAAGITRSTAQRLAFTLQAAGLLKKDPKTKRYSLAANVLETACHYLESHPLVDRANAVLLELNRDTGETVNLAEPSGTDMVYICRFPSPLRLLVHMPIGRRIPMFCSSSGRVWLASLPTEKAREILNATRLVQYTNRTITDVNKLMARIQQVRDECFACCLSEYYQGDLALAVPIRGKDGHVAAALQLSVPSSKWTMKRAVSSFIPKMQEAAAIIVQTAPSPGQQGIDNANPALGSKDLVAAPPRVKTRG